MRGADYSDAAGGADLVVIEGAGASSITVPDATRLFTADFAREGPDLVLHNDGAPDIRILDYFSRHDPVDLQSPDGAVLRGDLVERLAGPLAPGQYAQAGPTTAEDPIGQVESVEGDATAQRADGTRIELNVGTKIHQNDVITTGPDSKVSITFVDGTIFSLAADSRMIIDDLVYEIGGSGNRAVFDLIEGGFVFLAGEVAKTGDMDVNTPTATMGIRGTFVKVDMETHAGETTVYVSLNPDPGTLHIGMIELKDNLGNLIANITSTDKMWIISPVDGETRVVERTAEDYANDAELLSDAANAYELAYGRVAGGESFVDLPSSVRQQGNQNGTFGNEPFQPRQPDTDDTPRPQDEAPEFDGGNSDDSIEEESSLQEDAPVVVVNIPPQAQDDIAATSENGAVVVTVLNNDRDTDGDFLTVTATNGSNGTTQVNADGTITYTPNESFAGQDSFTYTISDGQGGSDTATVTVTVAAGNDAPDAQDEAINTVEDGAVTVAVLANDSDANDDPLAITAATDGTNGTTFINPDGTITYQPDEAFTGQDNFTYTVSDGQGGTNTATVTVKVLKEHPDNGNDNQETFVGTEGNDYILGGDGGEEIYGQAGDDLLQGGAGGDVLSGGAGTDSLEGGTGNDTLRFEDRLDTFDGNEGRDVLAVSTGADTRDDLFGLLANSDIEAVDLENASSEALVVGLQDVINLSSTADSELETLLGRALPESATILGDSGDTVTLQDDASGNWQLDTTVTNAEGTILNVYEWVDASSDVLATLAIDDDITVVTPVN